MINAVILSGHSGKPVDVPVDRAAYDSLLAILRGGSSVKTTVREQRVTDQHYAGTN